MKIAAARTSSRRPEVFQGQRIKPVLAAAVDDRVRSRTTTLDVGVGCLTR
jgi:hypothetical protein